MQGWLDIKWIPEMAKLLFFYEQKENPGE